LGEHILTDYFDLITAEIGDDWKVFLLINVFCGLAKDNRDITVAVLSKVCIFGYLDDVQTKQIWRNILAEYARDFRDSNELNRGRKSHKQGRGEPSWSAQ